jgi:hypothetical protein
MDVTLRTKPVRARELKFYHRLFQEEIKIKIDGESFFADRQGLEEGTRFVPPSPSPGHSLGLLR